MTNEKPGGHGERSVAVGTIDMAVWDAVAKIAGQPLPGPMATGENLFSHQDARNLLRYGAMRPDRDTPYVRDRARRPAGWCRRMRGRSSSKR